MAEWHGLHGWVYFGVMKVRLSTDGLTDELKEAVVKAAAVLVADAVADQLAEEIVAAAAEMITEKVADAVAGRATSALLWNEEAMDRLAKSIQEEAATLVAGEVRRQMTHRKLMRNANRLADRIVGRQLAEEIREEAEQIAADEMDGWSGSTD